jgi:Ca-activated chloride channel family protein
MRWRRRRETVRMSSVRLIQAALPGGATWRRRIPLWLFAVGLVVLGTGAARPQASIAVPSSSASILLAIDVSPSMCSTDVEPNRLAAAKKAAKEFIEAQGDGTKIGLVAFAGIAALVVQHTTDKEQLLKAIDGLRTSRGTAIGLAILASIDAIAEINPDVAPTGVQLHSGGGAGAGAEGGAGDSGEYEPNTIVVLTDGRNTQGVDPVTAAGEAAARHLRVYTIGFGTTQAAPLVCSRDQIGNDAATRGDRGRNPGAGGFGGGGRYQQIDEAALTEVADVTGGEYFRAEDSDALTSVLLDLPDSIVLQRKNVEITVWFALAGAILLLVAVGLSQWWNRSTVPDAAGGRPSRGLTLRQMMRRLLPPTAVSGRTDDAGTDMRT